MKVLTLFPITPILAALFFTCGNLGPEDRGYDERLFGRSKIFSPGAAQWYDSTRTILFHDEGNSPWIVLEGNGYHVTSDNWYTSNGKINARDVLFSYGGSGTSPLRPYGEDITFSYRISGDTLTLSSGHKSRLMTQFVGIYTYWDVDADFTERCAINPNWSNVCDRIPKN